MLQIIPAILATTEEQYLQDLKEIESCDELITNGWIQLDFMDNQFVQNEQSSFAGQNKSIEPGVAAKNPPKLNIEAHMMVKNPSYWADQLLVLKPKRVIIPIEIGENAVRFITESKGKFEQIGLSINPETDINLLESYINMVDSVLIMTVHPGFQGQQFLVENLDKVSYLKSKNKILTVGVDGGVSVANIKLVANVGADYAVIGSHLLKGDINLNLQKFKEALDG